jgi:hypothetical protein
MMGRTIKVFQALQTCTFKHTQTYTQLCVWKILIFLLLFCESVWKIQITEDILTHK